MKIPKRRSFGWKVAAIALVLLVAFSLFVGSPQASVRVFLLFAVPPLIVCSLAYVIFRGRADRKIYEDALRENARVQAIAEERLSLARDLHDTVSNGLGSITVRAAVAQHLADKHPENLMAALVDIESASRRATDELRRMLELLRGSDQTVVPVSSRDNIESLLANATKNGLEIDYVGGDLNTLPASARFLIYQIVREALTNTARYCGPTGVTVSWFSEGDVVRLVIQDKGPGPQWGQQSGAGQGLRGLKERVETISGTLDWGPTEDGGFEVRASLPTEA